MPGHGHEEVMVHRKPSGNRKTRGALFLSLLMIQRPVSASLPWARYRQATTYLHLLTFILLFSCLSHTMTQQSSFYHLYSAHEETNIRQVKKLAQGHTGAKWCGWHLPLGPSHSSESRACTGLCFHTSPTQPSS